MLKFEQISNQIIGCAIEVHRALGPGLLESAYEQCLAHELARNDIEFQRQAPMPVTYKGLKLDCGYRLDLIVADSVIVELKSVEKLLPVHEAQILTYLKLSGMHLGLLINFNESLLKNGIKRFILDSPS
jgi:GxxExxY protein